jgi:arginase
VTFESLAYEPDTTIAERRRQFDGVTAAVEAAVASGDLAFALGGDHSITQAVVPAFGRPVNILHFDAHPDLYPHFDHPLSHASPFARLLERGCIARLVQIGIRTLNAPQAKVAAAHGVEMFEMRKWAKEKARACSLAFEGPLYVSVDLDALDPAFAPGESCARRSGEGRSPTRQECRILSRGGCL